MATLFFFFENLGRVTVPKNFQKKLKVESWNADHNPKIKIRVKPNSFSSYNYGWIT